jgi:hypothetical protein
MTAFRFNLPFLPAVANRYLGGLAFAGRGMAAKTPLPVESGNRPATAPSAPVSRRRRVFVFPMF